MVLPALRNERGLSWERGAAGVIFLGARASRPHRMGRSDECASTVLPALRNERGGAEADATER
jgi:hypothetical protein